MADKASMTSYLDNATTNLTFKPLTGSVVNGTREEVWSQADNSLSQVLRARVHHGEQKAKNGESRRMVKVVLPIAEVNYGSLDGYIAPPAVAYEIPAYVVVQVPGRATDTEVANALRLLVNEILGDTAAGTANAYRDAANAAREFLVHGFMVD